LRPVLFYKLDKEDIISSVFTILYIKHGRSKEGG